MAATVHNNHRTLAPSANCSQPSSSSGFFSNFELLSKDSVKKLVLSVPTRSCSLDPVPTKVVKECLDELVPLLTVESVFTVWCLLRRVERGSCNPYAQEEWFRFGVQELSSNK